MNESVDQIRVAAIDDHELARGGLIAMLRTAPWIEIVGATDGCTSGIELVRATSPDVVLVDVRMPDVDGLTCLSRLLEIDPPPKVIMVSGFDEAADVLEAINRGACGYLLKSIGARTLVDGVRDVVNGRLAIDPDLLRLALSDGTRPPAKPAMSGPNLTVREMDVLRLVAEGQTNKEIGGRLGISEDTVKKHVQNVIWKFNAADRTQAAILAMRLGLLENEPVIEPAPARATGTQRSAARPFSH